MRAKSIVKRENKGLRGEINGTRAQKEKKRSRWKIKGADRAEGQNKMHDRGNNM